MYALPLPLADRGAPSWCALRTRFALLALAVALVPATVSASEPAPRPRGNARANVRALFATLHGSDAEAANDALQQLRTLGLTERQIELGKKVSHPEARVRVELASSLSNFDPQAREMVVPALADDADVDVRIALVEGVRDVFCGPSARSALRGLAAGDEDARVRGYARLLVAEWDAAPVRGAVQQATFDQPSDDLPFSTPGSFGAPDTATDGRGVVPVGASQVTTDNPFAEGPVLEPSDSVRPSGSNSSSQPPGGMPSALRTTGTMISEPGLQPLYVRSHAASRLEPPRSSATNGGLRRYWANEGESSYGVTRTAYDETIAPGLLDRPLGDEPVDEIFEAPLPPDFTNEFVITEQQPPWGFTGPSGVLPTEGQTSPHFVPVEDRWRIGFDPWDRYGKGHPGIDDYPGQEGHWWDPFNQNVLKGDYPIIGQHTFLNITAQSFTTIEWREVPTATTPFESTVNANQEQFFGDPAQTFVNENLMLRVDLFHGNAAFKPLDWQIRLTPIVNTNYLDVNELGIVNPDVTKGTRRSRDHVTLQEYFVEAKLADLGPDYDFVSARVGSQFFNSDFRGHIFLDTNRGARLFGTRFGNRDQFNLVFFDMVEKETNSELNTFDDRHQNVLIANYFRQDFVFPGYTAQASVHYNNDQASFLFDRNDFLVRPDPVGVFQEHEVDAVYLGFAGEGHIERFNVSHVLYWAVGKDSMNPIAGRSQDIDAYLGAIELSYDRDWIRFRTSFFYASGDDDLFDNKAEGFDTILDDPNFAGGNFSYWQRNAIRLFGVNVTQRKSLVANLRSSKIQGQSNFVNPGLVLVNGGMDFEITPKVKVITNVNYLWFDSTVPLEIFTFQDRIDPDIGVDSSIGIEYRPLLSDNVIMLFGFSSLIPASGFDDLFGSTEPFTTANAQDVESDPLFAAFFELVMTY